MVGEHMGVFVVTMTAEELFLVCLRTKLLRFKREWFFGTRSKGFVALAPD